MSTDAPSGSGQQPTEEELRAAYEAEMRNLRIEHLLLENVVAMVSLGMRRTGLSPGTEGERDPEQVRVAIESIRALMPLLEQNMPEQVAQIRSALSQLQLAFVKIGGQQAAEAPSPAAQATSEPGQGMPKAAPGQGMPKAAPGQGTPKAAPGQGKPEADPAEPAKPGEPGPAQRSGRLWVPGQ
jgi:hypothetical protein